MGTLFRRRATNTSRRVVGREVEHDAARAGVWGSAIGGRALALGMPLRRG
jgi:hypothetical protein